MRLAKIGENRPLVSFKFIAGDAEHLAFDGQFDLISSASAVQWFEQPQTFVSQAANLLQSNGICYLIVLQRKFSGNSSTNGCWADLSKPRRLAFLVK
ncbi:biotin synthesis protein [Actinobacillus equuli]|nr:biotin synthesis protein [Actinobacillus equuli]